MENIKKWFNLMWSNWYLPIFIIAFVISMVELSNLNDIFKTVKDNADADGNFSGFLTVVAYALCPAVCCVVSYLGFYKFWKEQK